MKRALAVVLALASLSGSWALAAQEKKEEPKKAEAKAPAGMTPEMKAMMELYEKAAQPGPNHKVLAEMAGEWDAAVKTWMGPGEPEISTGRSQNKMILGGRYLLEEYEGVAMGRPFRGMGITGYDNVAKAFTGIWIDDMSTGIMTSEGKLDEKGKAMESVYTFNDPSTGGPQKGRMALKIISPDKHVMEMFGNGPDGKEMLMMEITYTRKKK